MDLSLRQCLYGTLHLQPFQTGSVPRRRGVSQQRPSRLLVAFVAGLVCLICIAPSTLALRNSSSKRVLSGRELGIYLSASTRKPLKSLNWGVMTWGATTTQTLYIQNQDHVPVTLRFETANWYPHEAAAAFTVQWDLEPDTVLAPKALIPVTFSLIAPSIASNLSDFSFDVVIVAIQTEGSLPVRDQLR